MTHQHKSLIIKLLTGHFLRQQKWRGTKQSVWVLYDDKINPLEKLKDNSIRQLQKAVPAEIELFKWSKHKSVTLNLNMVRRLHGNHTIKRLYKMRHDLTDPGAINKKRGATKKQKQIDESVLFIF